MTKDRVSLDKYAAEAITANCIIWALKGLEAIVVLIALNDHNEESTEITVQGLSEGRLHQPRPNQEVVSRAHTCYHAGVLDGLQEYETTNLTGSHRFLSLFT